MSGIREGNCIEPELFPFCACSQRIGFSLFQDAYC